LPRAGLDLVRLVSPPLAGDAVTEVVKQQEG
jgi:hypothetical protein